MIEPDKKWPNPEVEDALRRALGLYKLTDQEARGAYESSTGSPLSPERLEAIIDAATGDGGERTEAAHLTSTRPGPAEAVREELVSMYRSVGGNDDEAELRMSEHRRTNLDSALLTNLLDKAGRWADEILAAHCITTIPVDPFVLAAAQAPLLTVIVDDFRGAFDGKLEYHARQACFLLFLNTKYDRMEHAGGRHPRTRFSLAHELGHFFLEHHHAYLRGGGDPPGPHGEFFSDIVIEHEADSFAAHLLMPRAHLRPMVNIGELTVERISTIATMFDVSLVCAMIQCVACSDFPHAVVAIRGGTRAWSKQSSSLIDAGCYPGPKGKLDSKTAREQWRLFSAGVGRPTSGKGLVADWFRTYARDDLAALTVYEDYVPLPIMDTLLVLLSIPEESLYPDAEEAD